MCGRFTLGIEEDDLRLYLHDMYGINNFNSDVRLPRYNISPGNDVIAVINDGSNYRAGTLKWGFVPFWAKDEKMGNRMINARAETIEQKPSYKSSFQLKRCVILADSFYEWKKTKSGKIPIRILLENEKVFPLAGLWSSYKRKDGTTLYTCTIITTTPNDLMKSIHDRMPVILTEEDEKVWLNPNIKNKYVLKGLLKDYDSNYMKSYEVSTIVNNTKNDSVLCIKQSNATE